MMASKLGRAGLCQEITLTRLTKTFENCTLEAFVEAGLDTRIEELKMLLRVVFPRRFVFCPAVSDAGNGWPVLQQETLASDWSSPVGKPEEDLSFGLE